MRAYAEANADRWYILSAEYGLVRPDQTLEPYERTLNRMGSADREAWAARVRHQLDEVLPNRAHVIVLEGTRYRENLIPTFGREVARCRFLSRVFVRQTAPALEDLVGEPLVSTDLDRFYELL